jgi:hypothetical protein
MRKYVLTSVSSDYTNLTEPYLTIYNSFTSKPTAAIAQAQQAIVDKLVGFGIWSKLDVFYMFATNTSQAALSNWIAPGTFDATLVNSPAFVAYKGFSGNGVSSYIRTHYNPSSDATNYLLNSASAGAGVRTNVSEFSYIFGGLDVAGPPLDSNCTLTLRYGADIAIGFINQSTSPQAPAAFVNTDSRGCWVVNRTANNYCEIRRDGVAITSAAAVSDAILDREVYILAANIEGGASFFSTQQCAFAFMGAGMTATQIYQFYNVLEEYFYYLYEFPDLDAMVGGELLLWNDSILEVKISEEPNAATFTATLGTDGLFGYSLTSAVVTGTALETSIATVKGISTLNNYINVYAPAGTGIKRLLMVGDSLTWLGQASRTQMIASLPHLTLEFLGTVNDGVYLHEGYGGYQWLNFVSVGSPFVNGGVMDMANYFVGGGIAVPDFVHIRLGVNEAFGVCDRPGEGFRIGELDDVDGYIKTLLFAFLSYNPNLRIIIGVPTISENTGAGWNTDYDELVYFHNSYIKAIGQLRGMIIHNYQDKRYNPRVYLSFEGYAIDRDLGYQKGGGVHTNGLHPSTLGYQQIGKSIAYTINAILAGK